MVQEVLRKTTDFLRRIITSVNGEGGDILSYICPHFTSFPLEDVIWWESTGHGDRRRSTAAGGVRYVEAEANVEHQTGYPWCRSVPPPMKQTCSERTPRQKDYVKKLIDALKLLANQQADGDGPIQSIVMGLQERNRKGMMDGSWSFIAIGNHRALDAGSLAPRLEAFQGSEAESRCR